MSTLEIQSAIGDTLLQVVLQQQAQAKKFREQLLEKQAADSSIGSKVYAKAA